MRLFFLSYIFLISIVGCQDNNSEIGLPGNHSEKTMNDTCDCIELSVDSSGLHSKDNSAYTGVCISYYNGTTDKYLTKNILNGLLHGKVSYYQKNGEILMEEMYENGKQKRIGGSDGSVTCECDELEISKMNAMSVYKLDNVPFTGKCEKYYENSTQIYMDCNYSNGLLHGYTQYYDKLGEVILMEKYEHGELVNTIH